MKTTYQITHKAGITTIRLIGTPSVDFITELMEDLAKNHPYRLKLYDLNQAELDLSQNDNRELAERAKRIFKKPNWIAFLVNNDLAFGEMRQLGIYRQEKGIDVTHVFRVEKEAREWLHDQVETAESEPVT